MKRCATDGCQQLFFLLPLAMRAQSSRAGRVRIRWVFNKKYGIYLTVA